MTAPIVVIRPHPQAPAAGNPPPPAPAAPGTIPNFDKMSFAQQRLAQDQVAAAKQKR
jgi:hypothetical protein